jgi:hypothetical protein
VSYSVTDSTEQWVWCLCTCVLCCIPICETRLIACKNRSLINSFIVVYYKRFTSLTVCFFSVCSLFDLNSRGCAMARLLHACFGNYGNAWINFIFQGMEEHSLGDEDRWKVQFPQTCYWYRDIGGEHPGTRAWAWTWSICREEGHIHQTRLRDVRFPCIFIYIYIFFKFISSRIKKKTEAESKDCHAKTMLSLEKPIQLIYMQNTPHVYILLNIF